MSKASVIRPGLLVSLKSTVVGGVSYQRIDLDAAGADPGAAGSGADVARWETVRTIDDKEEHERATKVRSAALGMIRKQCSTTAFGLLCPAAQEGALDAMVVAARKLVDEHNEGATHTRVGIYVLKGRVASDDAEAARAITQEVSGLVQAMDAGIKNFDPSAIRAAANRARELSSLLGEEAQGKIEGAIEQARKAARQIVKRIETEGEDRAIVMADIQRGQIESARIAFLDLSGQAETAAESSTPAVAVQRFADLDVGAAAKQEPRPRTPVQLDLDPNYCKEG